MKDYTQWALPLAEQVKARAEELAAQAGIAIEYLRKKIRKEDRVQEILAKRGNQPGLVCTISALERCDTYRLHRKPGEQWRLRPDSGKCLHYYFYFMDPQRGLGFLRLPTWAPFRVQVYLNGHNWLAGQLEREQIAYRLVDNAFLHIADWQRAQEISDRLRIEDLHRDLETTVNDLTFFQHYREVEQRDGQRVRKWAEMKKNIYSMPILQERLLAANWRYLQFLCALADPGVDLGPLHRITQGVQLNQRTYRGFNFFSAEDQTLLVTLLRGEFAIRGFANKDLRRQLYGKTSGQLSRLLKRLRLHGITHKIPRSYRYRLSPFGLAVTTLACKLKNLVILPELASFTHA